MIWAFDVNLKSRAVLENFLETFSLEELNYIPKGFNNNIIWNIAHTIVTQQLLVYKLSGIQPLIPNEMIDDFKKGTRPRKDLSQTEIDEIKKLLYSPIYKTQEDYEKGIFQSYNEYTVTTKNRLTNVDEAIDYNNFHEGLHLGYILALKNTF